MSVNTLERDVARLLQEGQAAARRGDRAMARALFTQLVEQDPRNEEAWMWLSGVVSDPDEQQICLENALVINPYNAHARKGLEFVLTKTNTPARVPLTPPAPAVSPVASTVAVPTPPPASTPPPAPAPVVAAAPAPEEVVASLPDALAVETPAAPPEIISADNPGPPALSEVTAHMPEPFVVPNVAVVVSDAELAAEFAADLEDAEPFIPPGMEDFGAPSASAHQTGPTGSLLGATADQVGDELPSWLQELTPSVPVSPQPQEAAPFSPFDMSDFPGQQPNGAGMQGSNSMNATPGMNDGVTAPAPPQPFGPADFSDMGDFGMGNQGMGGPVGPFSDNLQMPAPHELPGGADGFSPSSHTQKSKAAQPWYLQSSNSSSQHGNGSAYLDSTMLKSSTLDSTMLTPGMEDQRRNKVVASMPCPNCQTQVSETSLACPNCRYSFFVNCPYCHELLDTSEAVPDHVEPCSYCGKEVNKWTLGLGGVPDLVSQKNPGSRPGDAGPAPDPAFPAMKQTLEINTERPKGLSFGWLVDLLWLIAIVAMVWALTQLPTWLHLSGQY